MPLSASGHSNITDSILTLGTVHWITNSRVQSTDPQRQSDLLTHKSRQISLRHRRFTTTQSSGTRLFLRQKHPSGHTAGGRIAPTSLLVPVQSSQATACHLQIKQGQCLVAVPYQHWTLAQAVPCPSFTTLKRTPGMSPTYVNARSTRSR